MGTVSYGNRRLTIIEAPQCISSPEWKRLLLMSREIAPARCYPEYAKATAIQHWRNVDKLFELRSYEGDGEIFNLISFIRVFDVFLKYIYLMCENYFVRNFL